MNKIDFYEQCKVALHQLNIHPLDLNEYPEEVNAMLRKLGARADKDGLLRSPETRSAESLCLLDMIEKVKHDALVELRAKRAEVISILSLAVSGISLLVSILY